MKLLLLPLALIALTSCATLGEQTPLGGRITLEPILYGSFVNTTSGRAWVGSGIAKDYLPPLTPVPPAPEIQK